MFHDGSLQSGIAAAIEQSKYVACFITDASEESSQWEKEYLTDAEVAPLFTEKTVLLRIVAGSEEASFLSSFHPVTTAPELVIIRNGVVHLSLAAPVSASDFKSIVLSSLDPESYPPGAAPASNNANVTSSPRPGTADSSPSSSPGLPGPPATFPPTTDTTTASTATTNPAPHTSPIPDVLTSRAAQHEEAAARQRTEESHRLAEANRRQQAAARPEDSVARQAQQNYAAQERKRKREAAAEHERVLRSIEADKEERRAREQRERERRQAEAAAQRQEQEEEAQLSARDLRSNAAAKRRDVQIQVRLFDGSTIRSAFPAHNSLSSVRTWIDESTVGTPQARMPYTLKHLLPPQPARPFELSDEEESLEALGLRPSATLILVPINTYTEAYDGQWRWPGVMGLAYRGAYGAYGIATGAVGAVTGVLGRVAGYGQQPAHSENATTASGMGDHGSAGARQDGIKIRTLQDQRDEERKDDKQWYNGNQLNFEPNKDDDDDKRP